LKQPLLETSFKQKAKAELARLLQTIDDCCESMDGYNDNHVKLMLYFDEAHVLAEEKVLDDSDSKDMYDVLCSCFESLSPSPIFVIYLSTSSKTYQLAPQGSMARSARARQITAELQAPITETPFDCSNTFPIKSGELKLENLYQIEFMAQFGRPL
jgi:hypothetical protein